MRIKFYGTRGSIPVSHPDFMEFGGNTTSIKITRDRGTVSIFDAGTGIRNLGKELLSEGSKQKDIFIGFSHFHWDHIQGFPFFPQAYDPEMKIRILALGEDQAISGLKSIFKGQMTPEYFPIPLDKMGAKFSFLQVEADELEINEAHIRVIKQNHPGGSYGYRLEDDGQSIVICTDLEHGEKVLPEIIDFCEGADVLVHEAQYTDEELGSHRGWGHSSYSQALEVAEKAGVGKLAITHHDPDHDDSFLLRIEEACQARFPNCVLAREGMELSTS